MRILPEPQDLLEGDVANCAGTPSDRVQLHDVEQGRRAFRRPPATRRPGGWDLYRAQQPLEV